MPDPTAKHAEAERGRALAGAAVHEALTLIAAGRRPEAERVIVHAYHEGAHALDLVEQYHQQRTALDTERSTS